MSGLMLGGAFEGSRISAGRQRRCCGDRAHRVGRGMAGGVRRVDGVLAAFPDRREGVASIGARRDGRNPCIGRAMHAIPFDASLTFVPIAHRHPPANWLPVCPCSPALTVAIESPCCCLSVPGNPNFAVSDRQQSQDPRRHPIAHAPPGLCPAASPREPVTGSSSGTPLPSTSWRTSRLTHPPHHGAPTAPSYVRLRPGYARLRWSHTKPGKSGRQALGKSWYHFES